MLDALQINTDPNFWNALLNPQLNYAEQMSLEQYRESMGECEEYTNETEEYEACLCAISPYWARIDNYIQCHEYRIIYWYHPDYLGHNELITDRSGNPYQYFHYTAWGESFAQAIYYLNVYDLEIGLQINFGSKRLEFQRVHNKSIRLIQKSGKIKVQTNDKPIC